MSEDSARVQEAILAAVAAPDAAASYEPGNHGWVACGPQGVPLAAILFDLYRTGAPSRTQRASLRRAIRELTAAGQVRMYKRPACRSQSPPVVSASVPCQVCGMPWLHRPLEVVGRLPTSAERAQQKARDHERALMLRVLVR